MQSKKIVIGTRGSQLSLAQTEIVKNKLQKFLPGVLLEIKVIKTQGDKNMAPIPLDTVGKGWFTKELDQQLLDGTIDLAVHSLKDIPDELTPGLMIACIPERQDAREALVSKDNIPLAKLKKGAIVGTDSARRTSQLLHKRPDLIIKSLRGNVNRRLEKLDAGEYDAICLAVAGLKRLGLSSRISEYFDEADMIPSPGQGALAIVIRDNDKEVFKILQKIQDQRAQVAVHAEREFSRTVGGGCKVPIGAYAAMTNDRIILHGYMGSLDGKHRGKATVTGGIYNFQSIGKKLAQRMLKGSAHWYQSSKKDYVVITRPLKESMEFASKIASYGFIPLPYPTISITKTRLSEKEQAEISCLDTYDWIVFTSSSGVKFFMQALDALSIDLAILQTKKIAAVGPKTAETLLQYSLPVSFIPAKFTTNSLGQELPTVLQKKILLPRSSIANPLLQKALEQRGAIVTNIPIYKTTYITKENAEFVKQMQNGSIACITFTSPSTLHGFIKNISEEMLAKILSFPILSIGPVTTTAAQQYGFTTIYTADTYTTDGMLQAFQEHIV